MKKLKTPSLGKRVLVLLKGEVLLQMGNISEAEGLFKEAIRMANESGLNYGLAWGSLARTYLQAGREREALRIIMEEATDGYSAAFVYWKTGQLDFAKENALEYYEWAWAQGEPYVNRYHLEQARGLLQEMGVDEPQLPEWDESKYEPFLYEDEVKAFIEEYRRKKEEAREEEERQRRIEAGEEIEEDDFDLDDFDLDDFDFGDDE
jgi:tetratricopeptide (TPR) repeat protein